MKTLQPRDIVHYVPRDIVHYVWGSDTHLVDWTCNQGQEGMTFCKKGFDLSEKAKPEEYATGWWNRNRPSCPECAAAWDRWQASKEKKA